MHTPHRRTTAAEALAEIARSRPAASRPATRSGTRLDAVGADRRRVATSRGAAGNKTNWKAARRVGRARRAPRRRAATRVEGDELIRDVEDVPPTAAGSGRRRRSCSTRRSLARADGTLEFHDLLVFARRLLATRPDVRAVLHARYQRVLLDEFQDTDPIQLEIAVRLTARPDDPAHDTDWRQLRPLPERLFIVGDPKQSIYRFRRADIAQYLRAAEQTGAETAAAERQLPLVGGRDRLGQPRLLRAHRRAARRPTRVPRARGLPSRPPRPRHRPRARSRGLRRPQLAARRRRRTCDRCEAAAAADAVVTALVDGWPVEDEEAETLRPCRPGDITVLLPARTSLPALEAALRERGVPYRAENSSVVYTTAEIRHLMLALRAADDPTDELALVAALRSPLYGCSDVELYEWVTGGGRWNIWAPPPEALADHPVAEAIAHVRSIASADLVADARRPAGRDRRRTSRARRRTRQPRCQRRLASRALRDRPGAGVGRCRRARCASLPVVGAAPGVGGSHRRHDPARARPRRRADHDHPRRQGPRVPDHHRVRAHHQAAARLVDRRRVADRDVDARRP